jgi:hypothetical protein
VRAPIEPPGHDVGEELRGDRVEELAADRQPQRADVQQQLARRPQPGVDVERAVQSGIVDQALPADGGARLLEVGAHHDAQLAGDPGRARGEPVRVVEGCGGVVDRARPDDDEQPVVTAVEDVDDVGAGAGHGVRDRLVPPEARGAAATGTAAG